MRINLIIVSPVGMIAKCATLLAFAALTVPMLCNADVTKLTAEQRKRLQESIRFHAVHTVTNLPSKVIALCADENGRLSAPGQKWEANDSISDSRLPRKRLIWAATDGEYYIVHYERGDYTHSFHVVVATVGSSDTRTQVVWRGVGDDLKNLTAFRAALAMDKLGDRLEYAH